MEIWEDEFIDNFDLSLDDDYMDDIEGINFLVVNRFEVDSYDVVDLESNSRFLREF